MAGGAHQAMRLFAAGCHDADIAVIEGVMGLFDGSSGSCPESSTSGVARLLTAPVLVVFGARGMAETAGPLMRGLVQHDPLVNIVGAIPCGTGSETHAASLVKALAASEVDCLGYLQRDERLAMSERHLGLIPDAEMAADEHLANWTRAAETLDLDRIIQLAEAARDLPLPEEWFVGTEIAQTQDQPVLAVAWDAAFSFYYQDSLDALKRAGLRLVDFSPLLDTALPAGTCGVYLGGGFPELYAAQLSANKPMLACLRQAWSGQMPFLAECGGYMSLCETLTDFDGQVWPMAGIVPAQAIMGKKLAALGYRRGLTCQAGFLGPAGTEIRGHEFHYSKLTDQPQQAAIKMARPGQEDLGALAGFAANNLVASYLHLYLPGHPEAVEKFAAACRAFQEQA
jgi:cobyrinic acid a,c-diamide synthase